MPFFRYVIICESPMVHGSWFLVLGAWWRLSSVAHSTLNPEPFLLMHECGQRRQAGRIERRPGDVQDHAEKRVVAHDADHIDRPLLPESLHRAGICHIAYALVMKELIAEVVHEVLIGRHASRSAALRDRLRDIWADAGLDGDRLVHR